MAKTILYSSFRLLLFREPAEVRLWSHENGPVAMSDAKVSAFPNLYKVAFTFSSDTRLITLAYILYLLDEEYIVVYT